MLLRKYPTITHTHTDIRGVFSPSSFASFLNHGLERIEQVLNCNQEFLRTCLCFRDRHKRSIESMTIIIKKRASDVYIMWKICFIPNYPFILFACVFCCVYCQCLWFSSFLLLMMMMEMRKWIIERRLDGRGEMKAFRMDCVKVHRLKMVTSKRVNWSFKDITFYFRPKRAWAEENRKWEKAFIIYSPS